jgi:hypothetical protein
METKMKAVISAKRMLIAELLKTNRSEKMVEYWINEVRDRSILLEDFLVEERKKEKKELADIFGLEFIKNLKINKK